jgi:hypothetical protein
MTPDEIGPYLERIAATDPRILPTDKAEAIAATALWAVAMAPIPFQFAVNAVAQHYADSPYLVKPADVVTRWRAHARDAADRHVDAPPATDDPHEYLAQIRTGRTEAVSNVIPISQRNAHRRQALGPGMPQVAAMSCSDEDILAIRTQGDFVRLWKDTKQREQAKDDARKALVLQHEDLCQRLEQAHGLSRAECWNGRIPPERLPSGLLNPSPIRTALLAIVAEAERRAAA